MTRTLSLVLWAIVSLLLTAYTPTQAADHPTGPRTITLPNLTPDMPDGPNKPLYMDRCTQCHTPRYVLNQPGFSRDTWVAEIQKMKKNYGAPIADEQVDPIADYLFAVRGK